MIPILTLDLVWGTVVNQVLNVIGQDILDVKHLKTSLFANSSYDKHLRLVKNQSRPITVSRLTRFLWRNATYSLSLDLFI